MESIAEIITAGVSVCAALASALPAPAAGSSAYKALYAVIQFVGFNFGKAKNAQDR